MYVLRSRLAAAMPEANDIRPRHDIFSGMRSNKREERSMSIDTFIQDKFRRNLAAVMLSDSGIRRCPISVAGSERASVLIRGSSALHAELQFV